MMRVGSAWDRRIQVVRVVPLAACIPSSLRSHLVSEFGQYSMNACRRDRQTGSIDLL